MKIFLKLLLIFFIIYKQECFPMLDSSTYKNFNTIKKYKNLQEDLIGNSFLDYDSDFVIYNICDNMLIKKKFLLPNTNWIALKIFLAALVPISAGTNNLVLAVNNKITTQLILLTQFTVPLNINNVISLLDISRLYYKQGLKIGIVKFKRNKAKSFYLLTIMGASICLGYVSSIIDNQTSGDAYSWIVSHFTNSEIASSIAYEIGYSLKLFFATALNSVFFFNFINEIAHKTGAGYALGFSPSIKYDQNELNYYLHISNIKELVQNPDLESKEIETYFSDRRINTTQDIANLKLYCLIERNGKKISNAIINVSKLCFITVMAVFCGEAFRQVFASKLLFKNFIETFSNHTANGNYSFILKNGNKFFCSSIDNCISTLNVDNLEITNDQIDYILSHNQIAIIANTLKGIAVSTNTASILIAFFSFCFKIKKNEIFNETIYHSFFTKKNIIPVIFASSLAVSGYFYMQNFYNIEPVAKKVNKLLSQAGKELFLPVQASIILAISVMGLTFAKGTVFLVDLSRSLISIVDKIYNK